MLLRQCANIKCKRLFLPSKYQGDRQEYCDRPECRRASACWSRKKWRLKEEERNPLFAQEEAARVGDWRARKKCRDAAARGRDIGEVVERLRQRVKLLEALIKGLAAFLGGRETGPDDVQAFLKRCVETVLELGLARSVPDPILL